MYEVNRALCTQIKVHNAEFLLCALTFQRNIKLSDTRTNHLHEYIQGPNINSTKLKQTSLGFTSPFVQTVKFLITIQ